MTHNADVKSKWIEAFKTAFLAPFHENNRANPDVIKFAARTAELSWDESKNGEVAPETAAEEIAETMRD